MKNPLIDTDLEVYEYDSMFYGWKINWHLTMNLTNEQKHNLNDPNSEYWQQMREIYPVEKQVKYRVVRREFSQEYLATGEWVKDEFGTCLDMTIMPEPRKQYYEMCANF